jgi:nucleoside-diphosphate-sugar epimerase
MSNKCSILFTSTSEIYGDPLVNPQTEKYNGNVNTQCIRSCYDEGKRMGETIFFEYHRLHKVDTKIVRIFNTYGPYMDANDGRVISNFINQSLKGEDLTVYGEGSQTRSLCYVSDLVRGLIAFMESEQHGPINMGNPNELTINDLATKIQELCKTDNKVIHMDMPEGDPKLRCPDITLAKELLDWEPHIDIENGLVKTIEYYRNQLE